MESFEQLSKQYEPMIYKIMHTLHIYKNLDEFYQLGLIGLWEASNRFDPTKGNFTNYAYTYIKGLFLSEMSKTRKNEERTVHLENEVWELMEDANIVDPYEEDLLLPYSNQLTENQKKWLKYTCLEGLSVKEIAEIEKVSVSAVKSWRAGARRKLR
jgi:RNA polymerase sigma factor (sigma-70 family)